MNAAQSNSSNPGSGLLNTKLMPPRLHASMVPRPDLLARLDESLSRKLIVVSAPTGFGKTTLVAMWLAERPLHSAWLALDENDNDPVRFWTYVVTALRSFDVAAGKTALAALAASQPAALQMILTGLINDLARLPDDCVLVLDDYHLIETPEIRESVAFLLQHLPSALHVVLVTRQEPDLPLGLLRARDELLEIDTASLRFTPAETAAFLREAVPLALPPALVEKLQQRIEGWAAGLRLVALSLKGQPDAAGAAQALERFSGSHRYVADYLTKEVFEAQPEPLRDFLLKTCFLSRLNGALCDALTGGANGERLLEQLERQSLFVVRLEHKGERVWYRYNPLFAESIQYLARQRLGDDGVRSIFEKACDWYTYQQMYDEAIEAALTAGLFERTMALIETFIEIYSLSELHTLTRWLERIPSQLVLRSPETCLAYAQVILFTGDRYAPATAARIEPLLQAAQERWQADGNQGKMGAVLALRAMTLVWQGDFARALGYAYQSLELLPEPDVFWRAVSLLNVGAGELYEGKLITAQSRILEARALHGAAQNVHGVLAAAQMLGEVFYQQGDLEQCAQINRQIILDAVGDEPMLDDQGEARLGLAKVAYERNDLSEARALVLEALDLARQRSNAVLRADAVVLLALIDAAAGETDKARAALKTLLADLQNPAAQLDVQDALAWLALRAGEPAALAGWHPAPPDDGRSLFLHREQQVFTLARLRLAEGQPAEALALLEHLQADAREQGRVRSQVEGLCLMALAHRAAGDLPQAREMLSRALALGQPHGFRRLFLDQGAGLAGLLREAAPSLTARPLSLYAATLLHLFALESAPAAAGLTEPLSAQELRVLRLLAAGLSNGEIARELVVSTNTVKTHVKSIYRKLDVNARDEARSVAKELKLL
jgi:LuxR family maltose regulon positive regulatory protein